MDDLKQQIEKLVSNQEDTTNDLLQQILQELKKVNINLKRLNNIPKNRKKQDYYNFINKLRKDLTPIPEQNIFPQINFKDRHIGVTKNGYLYDKETNAKLKPHQAYEIYEFLYQNRDKLEQFVSY